MGDIMNYKVTAVVGLNAGVLVKVGIQRRWGLQFVILREVAVSSQKHKVPFLVIPTKVGIQRRWG
jgi:hypothetical protein